MGDQKELKHYVADMDEQGWEQVRELAEDFIVKNMFGSDPVKAVVNAYLTLLMLEKELDKNTPNDLIH